MKLRFLIFLLSLGIVISAPTFGANYLYKDKAGFLTFRCEGRLGLHSTKVRPQGWGYYKVIGPYIHDVILAPDSFEAATLSCGEKVLTTTRQAIGLKSFKDY